MGWFTDSPFERMMTEKPTGAQHPAPVEALPDSHPCGGCLYGQGKPCVGVCMRKVMGRSEKEGA